jgi:guanylate kinase
MHRRGNLFVVSGPSGAGKGTIIRETLDSSNGIKMSISVTTREIRKEKEVEGVNYYFKSKEEFQQMIEEDAFLEYATVFDNYYGTPKQPVLDAISNGQSMLLEIDIQGALQVKNTYPEAIFIFILPPSMKELKKRIRERGTESDASLNKRFLEAFNEISYIEKYDYFIVNDELENSIELFKAIIHSEKCRIMADMKDIINSYKEEL